MPETHSIPTQNRRLSFLTKLTEEGRKVDYVVDSASKDLSSQNSPGPTPLRLTEEMDTPGAPYLEKVENGRLDNLNGLTQTQYFCLVRNPLFVRVSSHSSPQPVQSQGSGNAGTGLQGTLSFASAESESSQMTDKGSSLDRVSGEAGSKPAMSCSSDPFASPDGRRLGNRAALRERSPNSKSPADRPIIGMVAAHWKDDEAARVSPKLWDGNGIPNSTNKYKEVRRA